MSRYFSRADRAGLDCVDVRIYAASSLGCSCADEGRFLPKKSDQPGGGTL